MNFDTALTDLNSSQFKTRCFRLVSWCFSVLACKSVPENWHICVNKGLIYFTLGVQMVIWERFLSTHSWFWSTDLDAKWGVGSFSYRREPLAGRPFNLHTGSSCRNKQITRPKNMNSRWQSPWTHLYARWWVKLKSTEAYFRIIGVPRPSRAHRGWSSSQNSQPHLKIFRGGRGG